MAPENMKGSSGIGGYLDLANERLHQGEFAGAIEAIRSAKSLEPKNIYVLAFEKQTEELLELQQGGTLTDEQRTDIFDSIPSIVEKALELSRTSSGVTDISALGKQLQDFARQSEEKAAALEWLKNQYFQHAHEYVRKGEYQNALAEIRRIFIIDPANTVARDFEKEIGQLAGMQRDPTASGRSPDSTRTVRNVPGREFHGTDDAEDHGASVSVSPGSPAPSAPVVESRKRASKQAAQAADHTPGRKPKRSYASAIIILMILIALGSVGLYFVLRAKSRHPASPETLGPPPPAEEFIAAPTQTSQQNFEVSPTLGDSAAGSAQVTQIESTEAPVRPQGGNTTEESRNRSRPRPGPSGNDTPPGDGQEPGDNQEIVDLSRGTVIPAFQPSTPPSSAEPEKSPERNAADTSAVLPFVAVEKDATILRLGAVHLTNLMIKLGAEGRVVVRVEIDRTGKPLQTVTLESTNDLLIQPVRDAVMASTFSPAEMTTGPVSSWLTIPFNIVEKKGK
jgi:tetratricopeptide (TPR) repeat protein